MAVKHGELISYIAPAAPATRRPADGDEPALRVEVGFTPNWYRQALDIDFGKRWHTDPAYRRDTVIAMRNELRKRFPGTQIGRIDCPDSPLDLLTGAYGACTIAAIYGVPVRYAEDNWPTSEHRYLSDAQFARVEPPDLDANPHFQQLMEQADWIAESEGRVEGYINWQGGLNNAQRLRGQQVFLDMVDAPDRLRHLLDCIATTMVDAARRLHSRQRETGVDIDFFTVSNCLVNMVSPQQYAQLLLPFDQTIASRFPRFGIHNCAWNADPYFDSYASIANVAYVDMGIDSDLARARQSFPDARRAVMYPPTDLATKPLAAIHQDVRRIARDYAPCDIVCADIEAGMPDDRVWAVIRMCEALTDEAAAGRAGVRLLPLS